MHRSRLILVSLLVVLLAGGPLATSVDACPTSARPAPALAMPSAAQALRSGQPVRILTIGSSTTAGVGASRSDRNYPSQLAGRLVDALGEGRVEVINAGVSGETAPSTLGRLQSFMRSPPAPHLVIWQVGTNDVIFGGDPARLRALVAEGLSSIAAAGAAAVVIDQQYFPAIGDLARYETFVAAVEAATSARGVPLLRRYAMMKQWAAGDPAGFRATLSWDSFHMNDAGYACLADLLAPSIIAAVRAPGLGPAPGTPRPAPPLAAR